MIIGIPRERFVDERRVSLSPAGVRTMVDLGATVYVENDAGLGAGWTDDEYQASGATIAYGIEEVFGRADILLKVLPPCLEGTEVLREEQVLLSYLQLPTQPKEVFERLVQSGITAIGLEDVEKDTGGHPVRRVMSEIAGTLSVQIGAQYLRADQGGRGVVMGGLPGVPPASVGIVGAGVVGRSAAAAALQMGAQVMLLDRYVNPLRWAMRDGGGTGLQTATINSNYLEKLCGFVDVLIGAVLIEDPALPYLITREMVRNMKNGAVIVDVAIDQHGTVETSRPTSISNPTYVEEGVIHYCVPNIPATVPRSATRAFQAQVIPIVKQILRDGMHKTLQDHPYLRSGLNLYKGTVTRETLAETFHTTWQPIEEVLG